MDVDQTAFRVLELATRDDDREGQLAGDTTAPELSREGAEELGIAEEVSSFSTPLTPGETRKVVGGGSSQLGTTFMNAAWFAGIALVEFQPHSLYFERYPVGREATLSFDQIDVVVENDSPHAILG